MFTIRLQFKFLVELRFKFFWLDFWYVHGQASVQVSCQISVAVFGGLGGSWSRLRVSGICVRVLQDIWRTSPLPSMGWDILRRLGAVLGHVATVLEAIPGRS